MKIWKISCLRSSASLFGFKSSLMKDKNGVVKFDNEAEGKEFVIELNKKGTPNVSYHLVEEDDGFEEW